jgi:hypothetical protein
VGRLPILEGLQKDEYGGDMTVFVGVERVEIEGSQVFEDGRKGSVEAEIDE